MNCDKAILSDFTANPGYGIARRVFCQQRWRNKARRAISARREKLAELLIVNKTIWRQK